HCLGIGMRATLDLYVSHLQRLLPQGMAWPREQLSSLTKLISGMAGELTRVHNRAFNLIEEADPRTSIELLPDWERVTGLPDSCSAGIATTFQERRSAVVNKLNERGGQSVPYFQGIAARLGYSIELIEYKPFIFGISQLGIKTLDGPDDVRFSWRVNVTEPRVTWFRMGVSELGIDPLAKIDRAEDLECRLHKLKPAQTNLYFGYQGQGA
ncbi:putative phage tail protein, partial [uncultured Kiloniella sp.]|uniref:YmfQ family protein n=1 Tax=uncultured Kiloniella sp. TaxID=1133091 RepID=UPI0026116C4E